MNTFLVIVIISYLSVTNGQNCQANFNESISGQCTSIDSCEGAILAFDSCAQDEGCCVSEDAPPSVHTCINTNDFDALYNSSRGAFLRAVLNYGIDTAGICTNCRAKAAFLAIAAAMTDDFQKDEATGTEAQFAADDDKYGNSQTGDGSLFRRRGLFGLRGREMYERFDRLRPDYQILAHPELAALTENSIEIAALLWANPTLEHGPSTPLTQHADGTFYGFSMIWYKLTGGIEGLSDGAIQYGKFLRQLQCGGDLYPGQGPNCRFNASHIGSCSPDCITGLENFGEYCGCTGGRGEQCPDSPVHVRCCLDTCAQELKLDLGLVMDASGSIRPADYQLQLEFVKNLLAQVNVGPNKTHVGIINFSKIFATLTWLDTDYELSEKIQKVDTAIHYRQNTDTAAALTQANVVFSPERGLRPVEDGVTPVMFVITDGKSDNTAATIRAAGILKNRGIIIISVGMGDGPDLNELHAICTPPPSENYFYIANYAALEQRINQFKSKTCTEPLPVPPNSTVTTDVSRDKYRFLKMDITSLGNKIRATAKVFNGRVKLFHSFTSRNPKDPQDFIDYEKQPNRLSRLFGMKFLSSNRQSISKNTKATNNDVTLVIDKPDEDTEFVFIAVKGVDDDNQFELKLEDCAHVNCRPKSSASTMKLSVLLLIMCFLKTFVF